jgi:hypothetical protein
MESNVFTNLSNDKFHQITLLYEKIISEIAPHSTMNLIEKNKLLMSKMVELLATIKMERRSDRDRDRLQPVEIKMDEKIVETEYIKLVNHNKPKEISFNEKIDKPFNPNELNTKLNEIINSRSYDIPTPQANKLSDKKVAFAANIESIEEVEVITIEKVYTLLQTMAKKQDTMIELLTNLKR